MREVDGVDPNGIGSCRLHSYMVRSGDISRDVLRGASAVLPWPIVRADLVIGMRKLIDLRMSGVMTHGMSYCDDGMVNDNARLRALEEGDQVVIDGVLVPSIRDPECLYDGVLDSYKIAL